MRASSGEAYREQLQDQVSRLGLGNNVRFHNRYVSYRELVLYFLAADVYVVPYLNLDQVVSGTLAHALGCGRAIVSTPSTYAVELLAAERGLLAHVRDAGSLASAMGRVFREPGTKSGLQRRAYAYGRQMIWPEVARAYVQAFDEICSDRQGDRPIAQPAVSTVPLPS